MTPVSKITLVNKSWMIIFILFIIGFKKTGVNIT
jgi:hypothetical protein